MAQPNRRPTLILALLLLAFGVLFVVRGPVRGISGSADLTHLYAASALWLEGGNPYDGQQCIERMRQAGYPNPKIVQHGSYYPPPSLATLAPLGLMSWESARLAWLVLSLIAAGAMVWAAASWLQVKDPAARWVTASLLVLAWGPVATTLSLGQLSLVAAASALVGLVLIDRGHAWLAGLLIGLGCLIKPQLGLGFLLLIAFRRDWLALACGAGLVLLMTAVGVGRFMLTAPDWYQSLLANFSDDTTGGQAIDASMSGINRFHMIDIRPVFHLVLPGGLVSPAALLTVGLLASLALWRLLRVGLRREALLATAGVGLLMLMPTYHRYYDAVLLVPLLVLIVNTLMRQRGDRLMIVIGLAVLPLFFPLPALLAALDERGAIPSWLAASWAWRHVVMIHQPWCLLIAAITLVWWAWLRSPACHAGDEAPSA